MLPRFLLLSPPPFAVIDQSVGHPRWTGLRRRSDFRISDASLSPRGSIRSRSTERRN